MGEMLGGTFRETAFLVQQTSDEGYVVAGETDSNDKDVYGNHGLNDLWIVKLDPYGTILLQKCLGGSDYDPAFSIESNREYIGRQLRHCRKNEIK